MRKTAQFWRNLAVCTRIGWLWKSRLTLEGVDVQSIYRDRRIHFDVWCKCSQKDSSDCTKKRKGEKKSSTLNKTTEGQTFVLRLSYDLNAQKRRRTSTAWTGIFGGSEKSILTEKFVSWMVSHVYWIPSFPHITVEWITNSQEQVVSYRSFLLF